MTSDGGLRALFRQHAPGFWQAVETGGVGRGVPDSYYCLEGRSGWVEFKLTETYRAGLRPEQGAWLDRHARAGGRAHIAVRRQHTGGPRKGPAEDDLYIYPGSAALTLIEFGLLSPLPSVHLTGGPRHWDWAAVRAVLLTP